jgi:hypothetical protein
MSFAPGGRSRLCAERDRGRGRMADALDPVTRAAVIARLSSDEVKKVRSQGQ